MRVYKVCLRTRGSDGEIGDFSGNVNLHHHDALRLTYPDNSVVIAPAGTMGIFVFRNYANALKFANTLPGRIIKSADALTRLIPRDQVLYSQWLTSTMFNRAHYRLGISSSRTYSAPRGTYTCRKLLVHTTIYPNKEA